jgi:hypothetical protein
VSATVDLLVTDADEFESTGTQWTLSWHHTSVRATPAVYGTT